MYLFLPLPSRPLHISLFPPYQPSHISILLSIHKNPQRRQTYKTMEKMPCPSSTLRSVLTSALSSGFQLAFLILSLALLTSAIYYIGTFLGRPWGGLFYHIVQSSSNTTIIPNPEIVDFLHVIGGFVALGFCGVATMWKVCTAERQEEEREGVWTMRRVLGLVGEGCLGGLVALGVTGCAIWGVGLGVPT